MHSLSRPWWLECYVRQLPCFIGTLDFDVSCAYVYSHFILCVYRSHDLPLLFVMLYQLSDNKKFFVVVFSLYVLRQAPRVTPTSLWANAKVTLIKKRAKAYRTKDNQKHTRTKQAVTNNQQATYQHNFF